MTEPRTEAGRRVQRQLEYLSLAPEKTILADILAIEAEAGKLDVERLARAVAVVFAHNASNASIALDGSLAFGGEPTSYWRDRAEGIADEYDR